MLLLALVISPVLEAGRLKLIASTLSSIAQKTWKGSYPLQQKAIQLIKGKTQDGSESFIKDGVKYVAAATSNVQSSANSHSTIQKKEYSEYDSKFSQANRNQNRTANRNRTDKPTYRHHPKVPSSKIPLFVKVRPTGAKVSIMNIKPKYKDGIQLKPGMYDIQISANGYRTRRIWVSLNSKFSTLEVSLSKRGQIKCSPTFQVDGHFLSGQRTLTQVNLLGVTLDELYFQYAKEIDKSNIAVALDSAIDGDFAYFDLIQPSHLTMNNIRSNSVTLEIDPSRHVKLFIGMERTTTGVKLIQFSEAPAGAYFAGDMNTLKESFCMELKNL